MKNLLIGILLGAVLALPVGVNLGKGMPLLTNPFTEKPLSQKLKEVAEEAAKKSKKTYEEVKQKLDDATK